MKGITLKRILCSTCHTYYDPDGFCPGCYRIEQHQRIVEESDVRREELAREEMEQLSENARLIADARNNPGDYDCPACLYRTLKYKASRCPLCRASPGTEYWERVDTAIRAAEARKREAREAAAREWEKGAPARAEAEALKKIADYLEAKRRKRHKILTLAQRYFWRWGFPFGTLFGTAWPYRQSEMGDVYLKCATVPILNWFALVIAWIEHFHRAELEKWLILGCVVGVAISVSKFAERKRES